jgi:hypothetical protein
MAQLGRISNSRLFLLRGKEWAWYDEIVRRTAEGKHIDNSTYLDVCYKYVEGL